jgi:hypothetical protein
MALLGKLPCLVCKKLWVFSPFHQPLIVFSFTLNSFRTHANLLFGLFLFIQIYCFMKEYLTIILVISGALLVLYIILRLAYKQAIVTSEPADASPEADQFYYLPGASLTITATATVSVAMDAGNIIQKASLMQCTLDTVTAVAPDTSRLIALKYNADIFSNDEVTIVTSAESLLQNVSSSVEDRLSHIIATAAGAPVEILTKSLVPELRAKSIEEEAPALLLTYETRTFTRVFTITPERSAKQEMTIEWVIPITGQSISPMLVNASFKLKNTRELSEPCYPTESYSGFYTRPLKDQTLQVLLAAPGSTAASNQFQTTPSTEFICRMPDASVLLKIPLRRAAFVKKVQAPKFSNGILIENAINKPSELEAFLSIPIDIGKALLSIPAALLQFKITQIKRNTEFEKAVTELAKAKKENATPPPPAPSPSEQPVSKPGASQINSHTKPNTSLA